MDPNLKFNENGMISDKNVQRKQLFSANVPFIGDGTYN